MREKIALAKSVDLAEVHPLKTSSFRRAQRPPAIDDKTRSRLSKLEIEGNEPAKKRVKQRPRRHAALVKTRIDSKQMQEELDKTVETLHGDAAGSDEGLDSLSIATLKSEIVDIDAPEKVSVPQLAHGLDRVLFNPGVYYLQDPRSHVYNFDPYLQAITPVADFNFDALTEYITSSRDPTLDELARAHDLKVVGSTSSMTSVLAQFHYLISAWRPVNVERLSSAFTKKSKQFTISQRAPASIYLRHNDGIYAIDADKSLDSGETVLSFLGRSMEKMLTLNPEEFSRLKKVNKADAPMRKSREAYHYSKIGKILMRSQLDCQDSRLPGTGTFDLKTRAVLPIRMDVKNAQENAGYQIFHSTGLLESFEREYYDMIRAAFLKYSMQVRIGKMDGIFVAYHNTERIFGFQYISLDEMDHCVHGSSNQDVAQREFLMSLKQLDKVLELAIKQYPGQSMALSFETKEDKRQEMQIIVEPLTEEEIKSRQEGELLEALKAAQLNERIKKMPSAGKATNSKATLESMSSTLEQLIATGKKNKSDKKKKKHDPEATEITEADKEEQFPDTRDRTMFTLTGTNVVNGRVLQGPPNIKASDAWQFKFKIRETKDNAEIDRVMTHIRDRQAQAWTDIYEDDSKPDHFRNDLKKLSDLGRIKLEQMKERQTGSPIVFRESSSSRELEQAYRKNFS